MGQLRQTIREYYLADESKVVRELISNAKLSQEDRDTISANAAELVRQVRNDSKPTMMEKFLGEYGLSTHEGVALMCLAEALLRVPDATTIDALIEDKVVSGNWGPHRGQSNSSLVNTSTWALLITGKLIAPVDKKGLAESLRGIVKRLGEPVVRSAVAQAMKELGRQFVLGRTISEATKRGRKYESRGYTYSYDMLGEAARTNKDALNYHSAYSSAISELSASCNDVDIRNNPGISVKLSALHARYEFGQRDRVMDELVPRTLELAKQAKAANMGFNIDAEEADRLDISLDVIEAVLSDPCLENWDGFGVVVQAFGPRASHVLDWLYALAQRLDRRIMVRLVKGAYWDAEIKRAQVMGLEGFPVFTRKVNTDVSYLACAKKLLGMNDRIYPQFATHNAHSVAAIMHLAGDNDNFEFQRLHGMGESLHDAVVSDKKSRCRIYAPVGAHQDLLAYLVRRLLENGANSSFVNQIVDTRIKPEDIARDPFTAVEALGEQISSRAITLPGDIYGSDRRNSKGWDITDPVEVAGLEKERGRFKDRVWTAGPIIAGQEEGARTDDVFNPAIPEEIVGRVVQSSPGDIELAIEAGQQGFIEWSALAAEERASRIRKVADLFEEHSAELFTLATREAGKTLLDAVGEVREAVDFALYYPNEAIRNKDAGEARGVIACISPWNFPLAIFSGQVLASLAAGNAVIAKPAGQTVLIAARAVELMHQAGIPKAAMQLLPGDGSTVGAALTSDARIAGVCFTGSTATAQRINKVMAKGIAPEAPLVAETGGLNAMIVDSTALPEQVVRDVLASSFQSAGQRCSALRMLYVQKDIAENLLEMLFGAMDELRVGNPWELSTDVGPVIDEAAKTGIEAHCDKFQKMGRVLKSLAVPEKGLFVAPTVIRLNGIEELEQEIFGPVLHVATFEADEINKVVDTINAQGYGLTFGLHTRVDRRVEQIIERIQVGNIYVNRNQIGAIVGSQPFGGEGLSGTGPKAGGPQYVRRFMKSDNSESIAPNAEETVTSAQLQEAIDQLKSGQSSNPEGDFTVRAWAESENRAELLHKALENTGVIVPTDCGQKMEVMPGPTGETNHLSTQPRGVVLCLGPTQVTALQQAAVALSQGNGVVIVAPRIDPKIGSIVALMQSMGIPAIGINGLLQTEALISTQGFDAVTSSADNLTLAGYRQALAERDGVLIPLITEINTSERFVIERHLCVDTTAAGGNASLIAASE
ncbi:bifunctional proline dehydrogenase/L-glutamate gamma-semialdehyde dehydrogenase [Motiliproteus sp. MSK22-1]|nr:bifunctional proline dehydrogenase/L-glutamate gamma-semialdehyde dehydrogenase [Motiliproteus sp. MSK22-1]